MATGIVGWKGSVSAIFRNRHTPQVCDAVVSPVMVDVVNLTIRPISIMKRPTNSMGFKRYTKDGTLTVSNPAIRSERLFMRKALIPNFVLRCTRKIRSVSKMPMQLSGSWIVPDQLTKRINVDSFCLKHSATPRCVVTEGRAGLQSARPLLF